jgi:tetratricopeptide (TPR) repeat protein
VEGHLEHQLDSAAELVDIGRYDVARPILEELAGREPQSAEVARLLAIVLMELGELRAARDHAERAIRLEPDESESHRITAEVYNSAGRHGTARKHAREAIRLDPEEPANWVSVAHASDGWRRRKDALAAAEKAIALDPGSMSGYIALSVVTARLSRWKACEEASRAALAIDPEEPAALNNLGLALLEQRRPDEAIEVLLAAGRRHPGSLTVKRNVGNALQLWAFGRRPTVGGVLVAGLFTFGLVIVLFPLYLPWLLYVEIRGRRRLRRFPRELANLAFEGRIVPRDLRDIRTSRSKIVAAGVVVYLTFQLLKALI